MRENILDLPSMAHDVKSRKVDALPGIERPIEEMRKKSLTRLDCG
jgi:hypothetical protein